LHKRRQVRNISQKNILIFKLLLDSKAVILRNAVEWKRAVVRLFVLVYRICKSLPIIDEFAKQYGGLPPGYSVTNVW
jgi:hypothetical protein